MKLLLWITRPFKERSTKENVSLNIGPILFKDRPVMKDKQGLCISDKGRPRTILTLEGPEFLFVSLVQVDLERTSERRINVFQYLFEKDEYLGNIFLP